MNNATEKIVIVGSGPAAYTAAIYAARANLSPLIIEGKEPGGQLMSTTYVENWPGEISILGPNLMTKLKSHATKFGTRFLSQEVTKVDFSTDVYTLTTSKNLIIRAHSIIICTGATPKKLNCKGEQEYWSKGVTTCAVCDGAFYKDKKIIIVGGGDSAMENASFMTNFTNKITIVHISSKLSASYAMQQKILQNPEIKIIYDNTVTEILGNNSHVTSAVITNQKTGEKQTLEADGIFISIGLKPNTGIFDGQLELNNYGYIMLKNHTETSKPGIFAAGDVADYRYRQAITSAGTGCAAALDAERYLKEQSL